MVETNYDQCLNLVVYELAGRPDEREVILGINGGTSRPESGGWKKISEYSLVGSPDVYIAHILGEQSPIRSLIKRPHHKGDQLFVGTNPERGFQFTIPVSKEREFVRIVEALAGK